MRIIVWNVSKAAHLDLPLLRELAPDLAVVPECAKDLRRDLANDETMAWCGRSESSGLAALGFGAYSVKRYGSRPIVDEWVMPVAVTGPMSFNLLAVWADMSRTKMRRHEQTPDPFGPLRLALRANKQFLRKGPTVVAGDFNNHPQWDKPLQRWNHSYAIADLESLELRSAYHAHHRCKPGAEEHPTFYMYKDRERPYHIDWCFVPNDWLINSVAVGDYETYCRKGGPSDHAPLIVDITTTTGGPP